MVDSATRPFQPLVARSTESVDVDENSAGYIPISSGPRFRNRVCNCEGRSVFLVAPIASNLKHDCGKQNIRFVVA